MVNWHEEIAKKLGSKHSDTQAVIRSGKRGAKRRTTKRIRQHQKEMIAKADLRLKQESLGITDDWKE